MTKETVVMRDNPNSLPDHLDAEPTFEEAEFLFDELDVSKITSVHASITELRCELGYYAAPHVTRYSVLGNYDEPQKTRLQRASRLLERHNSGSIAVLLDDLDPDDDTWENFYLKFRYVLSMTDHVVVVAEDNDGGHELELGEVSLEETYVLKREYSSASIRADLERQKYDAMMAKLCDLMRRTNRLFDWDSTESFAAAVKSVAAETQ